MNPNTPILVGVGQWQQKIESLDQAVEPLEMMFKAVQLAEQDTDAGNLLRQADTVCTIRGVWDYECPAKTLAARVGAPNARTVGTVFGGNYVQYMVNHMAAEVRDGRAELVVITGAENGYSSGKAARAGQRLPTTAAPGTFDVMYGEGQMREHHEYEIALGIQRAIQVYPMYENAIRHHRGETLDDHLARVATLWAGFSAVASQNPNAWLRTAVTAEEIRTASPTNRPISFPYTKLMNANLSVDMSAALILTSVSKAKALGVPENKWIYPLAGAIGNDHFSASVRDNFHSSPGIRLVGERALALAGVTVDQLDHVDLYSCFPAAVQVAADELQLDQTKPLTVTGGLTFGGGPLNNYVMHSVARTVELLRQNDGVALVTANGGNLYKHAHGVYGSAPPAQDFRFDNVQDDIDRLPARTCVAAFEGVVEIESYTVMYEGDRPAIGHVAARATGGERTWVNVDDQDVLSAMTQEEFCGRPGRIQNGRLQILG